MRRLRRRATLPVLVAVALAIPATSASANAAAPDLPEVRRLTALERELDAMTARYGTLEAQTGRAWLATVEAIRAAEASREALEAAEARMAEHVRTAYQFGPGGSIEAYLGAASFSDLLLISEYAARTLELDRSILLGRVRAEAVHVVGRARAEAAREALAARLDRMHALLDAIAAGIDRAAELAARARRERLERRERWLAEASARAGSWDLGVIDYRQDQSHLLALLGPTGGRTCETPAGLAETGRSFEGYASWYGWEFGGQPTATGAIFDPRLFTAANRWLPFGSFLRVRNGERCAIVLVNDRGPYGRLERVIDLSQAAAEHLGVGVSWVHADVLVPRAGRPAGSSAGAG